MKFLKCFGVFAGISLVLADTIISSNEILNQIDTFDNPAYEQVVDDIKFMSDDSIFHKRDESGFLESVLNTVYSSGVIQDVLYEIAGDQDQIDSLVNITTSLIKTGIATIPTLNISINSSNIASTVVDSGIVATTAEYLLMNDTNRDYVAEFAGNLLASNIWIPQLLNELGAGKKLSVDLIVDLINNTPNKNPKYNSSISEEQKQVILSTRAEDSALDFLNNVISGVLKSEFFTASLSTVFDSLNSSGIVGPLAMSLLRNDTMLSIVPKVISGLYHNGVFDDVDLNAPFTYVKEKHLLSTGIQYLFTSPKWDPPIAKLFKHMQEEGYMKDIEDGLYGPNG